MLAFNELPIERQSALVTQAAHTASISHAAARALVEKIAEALAADDDTELEGEPK